MPKSAFRQRPTTPGPTAPPTKEGPVRKGPTPKPKTQTEPPESEETETPPRPPGKRVGPATRKAPPVAASSSSSSGPRARVKALPAPKAVPDHEGTEEGDEDSQVPALPSNVPVGQASGEIDDSDFDRPQLKLAQSVGPLYVDLGFTPGDIVLGNEVILWQPDCEAVEITVLRLDKKFSEELAYGGDEIRRTFKTSAEAEAQGLVFFGGDDEGYVPIADLLVLIKYGEGIQDHPTFNLTQGKDRYAIAVWRVGGAAYKPVIRKIMTASRIRFKGDGFHRGSFMLEAKLVPGKKNKYWVPQLSNGTDHNDKMVAFAEDCGGQ